MKSDKRGSGLLVGGGEPGCSGALEGAPSPSAAERGEGLFGTRQLSNVPTFPAAGAPSEPPSFCSRRRGQIIIPDSGRRGDVSRQLFYPAFTCGSLGGIRATVLQYRPGAPGGARGRRSPPNNRRRRGWIKQSFSFIGTEIVQQVYFTENA